MFAALNSFLTRAVSGYFLNKSLRFRSSASAYLNRTATSVTNTYTLSVWVKRGTVSGNGVIFQFLNGANNAVYGALGFYNATDGLVWEFVGTPYVSTAQYRDPAAWYHIVVNSSGVMYVNGVSVKTGMSTASIASGSIMTIGKNSLSSGYQFDGELAEVNFVDGQALAPTAFGAYSIYNQWLPIRYAGIYGTNGFYLPFNSVSTSSYAGSFNGSSQYLTVANTALLEPSAAQAWTLETWINPTTVAVDGQIYQYSPLVISTGNDFGIYAVIVGGILYAGFYSGATQYANNSSSTIPINTWTHVASVSTGSVLTLYINGVSVGAVSASAAPNATSLFFAKIGYLHAPTPRYFPGQISNFRFVKGTAVYTANFVPPTAPLTAITNTSLLTLQSATVVDNSGNSLAITNNGTVVTSVQSPFLNPRVLVADSSGNANNWTPNNISLTAGSTYDSLTDVPTLTSTTVANYCVINPLVKNACTITNGNLTASGPVTYTKSVVCSIGMTTGLFYWEAVFTRTSSTDGSVNIGIVPPIWDNGSSAGSPSVFPGKSADSYGVEGNSGQKVNNSVFTAYGSVFASGDIIMIAYDATNGKFYAGKNGTWFNSGDPATGTNAAFTGLTGTYLPAYGVSYDSGSSIVNVNFGQQPFAYTPPTGFLPLNTFNI